MSRLTVRRGKASAEANPGASPASFSTPRLCQPTLCLPSQQHKAWIERRTHLLDVTVVINLRGV